MSYAGSQQADLMQCPLAGSYSTYLESENSLYEMASGSINIPWLLSLAVGEGNANTSALAMNAVVFSEPEWGFDGGGGGKDIGPGQQMFIGGSVGGNIVAY